MHRCGWLYVFSSTIRSGGAPSKEKLETETGKRMSAGAARALRRGVALRPTTRRLAVRPGRRRGKNGVDAPEEPPDRAAVALRHAAPQGREHGLPIFGRAPLHATPLGRQEDAARAAVPGVGLPAD